VGDVFVYGEVVPYQSKQYYGNGYCNLSYVRSQLESLGGGDVRVRINCTGGDVEEGFAIYSELRRYAKDNNARVETLAEGRCASIATVIFLAGDRRIVTEYTRLFVHNAWLSVQGDSSALEKANSSLEVVNDKIADHYARHTALSYDQARGLMDGESFIEPRECVRLRFATGIEEVTRPLARSGLDSMNNIKNDNIKSSKMDKKSTKLERALGKFKMQMKALFTGDFATMNKLVYTASGEELNFYELGEDEAISVGDVATLNGEPADGKVTVADGAVYTFEAGKLAEIKESGDEDVDEITDRLEVLDKAVGEILNNIQLLAVENKRLNSIISGASGRTPTVEKNDRVSRSFAKEEGLSGAVAGLRNRRVKVG